MFCGPAVDVLVFPFRSRSTTTKSTPVKSFLSDTANCPSLLVHALCLRQYLQVRGIRLNRKEQASALRRLYRRVRRLRIDPMDLKQWNDYRQRNEYYTATPFTYIPGSRRSTDSAVVTCLTRMVVIQARVHGHQPQSSKRSVQECTLQTLEWSYRCQHLLSESGSKA